MDWQWTPSHVIWAQALREHLAAVDRCERLAMMSIRMPRIEGKAEWSRIRHEKDLEPIGIQILLPVPEDMR